MVEPSNRDVNSVANNQTPTMKPSCYVGKVEPMKLLSKSITTANRIPTDYEDKYIFNASELLGLLLQVKELRQYSISLSEVFDGAIQLVIGDSFYQIFQAVDDA